MNLADYKFLKQVKIEFQKEKQSKRDRKKKEILLAHTREQYIHLSKEGAKSAYQYVKALICVPRSMRNACRKSIKGMDASRLNLKII